MTTLQLQKREEILKSKEFSEWFTRISLVRAITEKKRRIREQIHNNNNNKYREKMANVSEIQGFFNKNHGKKARVLKDINFTDSSLFEREVIDIDKTDKELIHNFAFKLSAGSKITEVLMILEI